MLVYMLVYHSTIRMGIINMARLWRQPSIAIHEAMVYDLTPRPELRLQLNVSSAARMGPRQAKRYRPPLSPPKVGKYAPRDTPMDTMHAARIVALPKPGKAASLWP